MLYEVYVYMYVCMYVCMYVTANDLGGGRAIRRGDRHGWVHSDILPQH